MHDVEYRPVLGPMVYVRRDNKYKIHYFGYSNTKVNSALQHFCARVNLSAQLFSEVLTQGGSFHQTDLVEGCRD